jgi:hypothetical protein
MFPFHDRASGKAKINNLAMKTDEMFSGRAIDSREKSLIPIRFHKPDLGSTEAAHYRFTIESEQDA